MDKQQAQKNNSGQTKVLSGTVISDKMDKTATVLVERYVKHPRYGKFMRLHKKYKIHDPENSCVKGDKVKIKEAKKRSKEKAFELLGKM